MNKTIQKYIYILLEVTILIGFGAFIFFNKDTSISYYCPLMQKTYTTNFVYISLFLFVVSHFGGYMLCAFLNTKVNALVDAYQKRHENISIQNDSDKAKIAALEAKIATLEIALESALKNK